MKIRTCFVSNSSSSSFIIMKNDSFDNITEDDIRTALKNIYTDYDKEIAGKKEYYMKNGYKHYEKYTIPFHVYDMENSESRKSAADDYGVFLSEWISDMSCRKGRNGIVIKDMYDTVQKWKKYCDSLEFTDDDGYSFSGMSLYTPYEMSNAEKKGMYRYDGKEYHAKPIPGDILKKCRKKWHDLRLCTNDEVMLHPLSRFMIHFNDNDVYSLKGMTDDTGYESEEYTMERFIEILIDELKRMGLLPDDYDWHDALESVGTCCMHEG